MSIGRRRRGGLNPGGGFSPRAIPGLVFYVDASYITGLNDGDSVTTWSDLSGNGYDATQATAAKKPIYKVNIVNGKPIVRYDGNDDEVEASFSTLAQPLTIGVVFIRGATGAERRIIDAGSGNVCAINITSTGILQGNAGTALNIPTLAAGNHIVIFQANGTSSIGRYDGSQVTGNAGTNSLAGITIGASRLGVSYFNGDVAAVVVYNSAISAANISRLERYWSSHYGITLA